MVSVPTTSVHVEWAKEEGEVMMGSYKNDSKLISFLRARVSCDYEEPNTLHRLFCVMRRFLKVPDITTNVG